MTVCENVTMLELVDFSPLSLPLHVTLLLSLAILFIIGAIVKNYTAMTSPEQPVLHYKKSPLNKHVLAKCNLQDRPFQPSPWLSHRYIQTLLPVILPHPDVTYEREYLQMRDKGVVALDWVVHPQVKPKKRKGPILLVIPPLTEGASTMGNICHAAVSRGIKTVVFNRRGHGNSVLTTPKLQSFGDPSDLRQVIKYIRSTMSGASLSAIAYGTGCGLLMSYLGEFGSSALLTVCACVSPCYDVPLRLSSITNIYDLILLLRLKNMVWKHAKALSSVVQLDQIAAAWTFSELDRTLMCPIYGYSDLEKYWEMNNPIRDVDDIEVPVLCINSLDDPTCSCIDIPYGLFKCYPNFLLAVTQGGGHCGFVEGFPPKSWSDELCLDYVESVIEFTTKPHSQGQSNQSGQTKSPERETSPTSRQNNLIHHRYFHPTSHRVVPKTGHRDRNNSFKNGSSSLSHRSSKNKSSHRFTL